MSLFDMLNKNKVINKKAKLLFDISLTNGEYRKTGDEVSLIIDYGNGEYHAEDNGFACRVKKNEIEIIKDN